MKKNRLILVILLIFAVMTLSGCIDAKYHLTVNKDGSGDLSYSMLMDQKLLAFASAYGEDGGGDPLAEALNEAKASGFTIANLNENGMTGFRADKHIENLQESIEKGELFGQDNAGSSIKPEVGLAVDKGFLKTRYTFDSNLDLSEISGLDSSGSAEIDKLAEGMLKSVNFRFALTMPVEPLTHNASTTEDEGKTLVWNLIPGQNNEMNMTTEVWNINNIAMLGGGILIILIVVAVILIKNRKSNDQVVDQPQMDTYNPTTDLHEQDTVDSETAGPPTIEE